MDNKDGRTTSTTTYYEGKGVRTKGIIMKIGREMTGWFPPPILAPTTTWYFLAAVVIHPIGRYFGYKPSWIGIEKRSEAPSSFFFSYTHSIRLFGQPPPPLQRGCWNKICVTDIFWLNICKYSYIIYEYTGWIAYTCIQMYRYIILSRQ